MNLSIEQLKRQIEALEKAEKPDKDFKMAVNNLKGVSPSFFIALSGLISEREIERMREIDKFNHLPDYVKTPPKEYIPELTSKELREELEQALKK